MKKLLSVILAIALVSSLGVSSLAVAPVNTVVNGEVKAPVFNAAPSSMFDVKTDKVCGKDVNMAAFCDTLHSAFITNGEANVSSFGIPYSKANEDEINAFITTCYAFILISYPDVLYSQYITPSYNYDVTGSTGSQIVNKITFPVNTAAYKTAIADYNSLMKKVLAKIPTDYSNVEKALWAYTYIVENFVYDETLDIRDPYNMIRTGTGVCQAYTLMYMDMMDRLNIPCVAAFHTDDKHPERNHTWNVIKLGSKWYNVDTTFADPVLDIMTTPNYRYFLFSDSMVDETDVYGIHSNPYILENDMYNLSTGNKIVCNDKTYESGYLWNNAETLITACGNNWYTVKNDKLMKYNRDLKTNTAVADLSGYQWKVYNKSKQETGALFMGYQGNIFTYGSYVCFSVPTGIKYYDTFSNTVGTLAIESLSYATEVTGCKYDGDSKVIIETNRVCDYDDKTGKVTNMTSFTKPYNIAEACGTANLVRIKKYIATGTCDTTDVAFMDIDNNGVINVIDLMKLKIKISENNWFPIFV